MHKITVFHNNKQDFKLDKLKMLWRVGVITVASNFNFIISLREISSKNLIARKFPSFINNNKVHVKDFSEVKCWISKLLIYCL